MKLDSFIHSAWGLGDTADVMFSGSPMFRIAERKERQPARGLVRRKLAPP